MTDGVLAGYSGIDDQEYRRRNRAWTLRLLAISVLLGSGATALLVFVGTGDWLLASAILIVARVGFAAGNVFHDGSSRPAVLGLIVFFVFGIAMLSTVDEEKGREAAREADAAAAAAGVIESG